ncbi:hypothetical protein JCM10207_004374 [Rhodosporidiobolus poonsookiae]
MSNHNPQHTRRTAPLISRPSAAPPPPPPTFSSSLGGAIAGALGGMGYAGHPPAHYGHGSGAHFSQGGGMGHALPPAPPFAGGGGSGYPPHGGMQPMHARGQQHWSNPPLHYPPQPLSAYPPSFYPPSHSSAYHPPPPAPYPPPYASTSSAPYLRPPQTTADGYTLSATYDPASEPAPRDAYPARQGGSQAPGKRARGGGQGGGRGERSGAGAGEGRGQQGPQIVKCCQADCTFTGRKKDVREHEEDRHLIYAPGREPKPWSGSLKPLEGAVIEGTGIALDTPEALAKWIEERKRRWPSKKVVEEKEKARAERVAAGLEAPPRERGARGRGRGRGQSDFGARGLGRGGRGGFVGDRSAHGGDGEGEPVAKRFKGEEGAASSSSGSSDSEDSDSSGSSSDDSDDDDGPSEEIGSKAAVEAGEHDEDEEEDEDDEGPEAEGVKKKEGAEEKHDAENEPPKRFQVVCRHWRSGKCALGDEKCPYLHHLPANAPPPPPPKRKRPAPPPPPHNPFARPASFSSDPFALLAERDHRHIVSDVLQVIEFLGANDWLRGVEIRPGQVDEESGIEVLGETTAEGGAAGEAMTVEDSAKPVIEEVEAAASAEPAQAMAAQPAPPALLASAAPSSTSLPPPLSTLPPKPTLAPSTSTSLPAPPAPPPSTSAAPARIGLVDYGSDSDDEADAQAVAAALVGKA